MKTNEMPLKHLAGLIGVMLILAIGTVTSGQEINLMMLKDAGEGHGLLFSGEARKRAGIPEDIAKYIWDMQDQLSTWRQNQHKIPELGRKEKETHDHLMQALKEMGYKAKPIGPSTGIILDIPSADTSFTIGVRGDFDALPITEADDGRKYRSTKEGFSHACGHDNHETILRMERLCIVFPD